MAKPSWGKKLKCQNCGAVYYDMTAEKPICPKCAAEYIPAVKGRRAAPIPATEPKKRAALVTSDEEISTSESVAIDDGLDAELDDDDEDEGLIEDTSDLDDDDDDMAEIKEHVESDLGN